MKCHDISISSLGYDMNPNNAVAISGHDCSDLQRDGQAEWASMKQKISQNRPGLIYGKRTVVDPT